MQISQTGQNAQRVGRREEEGIGGGRRIGAKRHGGAGRYATGRSSAASRDATSPTPWRDTHSSQSTRGVFVLSN
eukprot:4422744-Pyramimonas_sp.AAC.1